MSWTPAAAGCAPARYLCLYSGRVKCFCPNHQICWSAEYGCRTQSAYAHSVWLLSISVLSCRADALIPTVACERRQAARAQGVSFTVGSAEKVGIVGRTGSGKSSLIVALFRLSEPYQGAVFLDGINLLELGLQVRPVQLKP